MSKATRLEQMLVSKKRTLLVEAHSGLSAKLAEEAGFEAIWASGHAVTASLGVRDGSEIGWTQFMEVVEFITDASDLPLLLDGDPLYCSCSSVDQLAMKVARRGVAGLCLVDRACSPGDPGLATVEEFCSSLKTARDGLRGADLVLVASTAALAAGMGVEEALRRASVYAESGADAIFCWGGRDAADEITQITAFIKHWTLDLPVIVASACFRCESIATFGELGVTNFVLATHSLRAVVTALRDTFHRMRQAEDLTGLEQEIAGVEEIP